MPQMLRSLIGAFIGIGTIAALDQFFLNDNDLTLVIGTPGATAVLVFGAPSSPLAQPYNIAVGHLVSAMVGVVMFHVIGEVKKSWLGRQDSNLRMLIPKTSALPLGDAPSPVPRPRRLPVRRRDALLRIYLPSFKPAISYIRARHRAASKKSRMRGH